MEPVRLSVRRLRRPIWAFAVAGVARSSKIPYFRWQMRSKYIFGFGMLALLGMAWLGSCRESAAVQDPSAGYLNLGPEARYTGRQSCQPCHQEIYASYVETGMGKSLYRPHREDAIERFGPGEVVHDAFSGYSYQPLWQDGRFLIKEFRLEAGDTTYERTEEVDYIVGSGHQTRSYLLERAGRFYEAPITWYVSRQRWDMSPGYEDGQNTRFDRGVGEECMACHTGHIDFVEGSVNQFREVSLGIDCEKCHGPGSIHIELKEAGELIDVGREIDFSIVNPAKLETDLQFDVCKQCHLQGVNVLKPGRSVTDYRPGMALHEVYDIFIERYADTASFGIASHGERLVKSRCFVGSAGEMTCTTCHNPHKSISVTDPQVYQKQCQGCHGGGESIDCGASAEMQSMAGGDCVGCHMPRGGTSDIPHVTFTDHYIRVVRDSGRSIPSGAREFLELVCMTSESPSSDVRGKAYLLYFERMQASGEFLDIAVAELAGDSYLERATALLYQGQLSGALAASEQALAQDPGDPWRLFKKAEVLEALDRPLEALRLYEEAAAKRPDLVEAGLKAGVLTLRTATEPGAALAKARGYFGEGLAQKPFDKRLLANMGFVEMNSGNFSEAERLFRKALSYDPAYSLALENMVFLQLQLERRDKAAVFLEQLLKAHPDYPKRDMMLELVRG